MSYPIGETEWRAIVQSLCDEYGFPRDRSALIEAHGDAMMSERYVGKPGGLVRVFSGWAGDLRLMVIMHPYTADPRDVWGVTARNMPLHEFAYSDIRVRKGSGLVREVRYGWEGAMQLGACDNDSGARGAEWLGDVWCESCDICGDRVMTMGGRRRCMLCPSDQQIAAM